MPQEKLPEPGEFTRIFKRQHFGSQSQADSEKAPEPPPTVQTPAAPSAEPGEFTQFFLGGLPGKNTAGIPPRNPSGVQRPNTPIPPRTLSADTDGSFTNRFGATPAATPPKADEFGVHNPRLGPAPDLGKESSPLDDGLFDYAPRAPHASPASGEGRPGEYTSLFGHGNTPPPPRQLAVGHAPAPPMMRDSPSPARSAPMVSPTLTDMPAAPRQKGPSEFTQVASGRPSEPSAGGASEAPSSAGMKSGTKLPLNVNISPMNPMASLGGGMHLPGASASANMSGAHLNTPLGSANLQAPMIPPINPSMSGAGVSKLSDQTKLVLFFGILAVLAVILVVAVVATQKN